MSNLNYKNFKYVKDEMRESIFDLMQGNFNIECRKHQIKHFIIQKMIEIPFESKVVYSIGDPIEGRREIKDVLDGKKLKFKNSYSSNIINYSNYIESIISSKFLNDI